MATGSSRRAGLAVAVVVAAFFTVLVACDQGDDDAPPAEENGAAESEQTEETQAAEEEAPLEWERPRFEERRAEREKMVEDQIAARGRDVEDQAVLEAMREVPRHLFVTKGTRDEAYDDRPLPIGSGQTISQPFIVAFMTAALELEAGDRVLEIGTGSAYQAAVLSELTPYVYTIEIIEKLGEAAAERLKELGYETITTKVADGYFGWEEEGPFDAIMVTCAAGHVPPPLIEQLKPGGRMIIPVGGVYQVQYLILITKDEEGRVRSEQVMAVGFVPMTGRAEEGK